MITFFLYVGTVLLSVTQSSLGKSIGKDGDQTAFNLSKSIAALLMFLFFGIFSFSFDITTLIYGSAFGVFLYLATWSSLAAFICGPLALTSMIASFSLVIPCVYGICFLNEPCTLYTIIGFILLSISLIFISAKARSSKKISAKWIILTAITLVTNGFCSLILKMHQTRFPGQHQNEFMLYAYFVASLIFGIGFLFKLPKGKTNFFDIKGALAGFANGGGNFLTLCLAGAENASVMFPVISVMTALAMLSVGRFVFREKLTALQICGFTFGIVSVILLNT